MESEDDNGVRRNDFLSQSYAECVERVAQRKNDGPFAFDLPKEVVRDREKNWGRLFDRYANEDLFDVVLDVNTMKPADADTGEQEEGKEDSEPDEEEEYYSKCRDPFHKPPSLIQYWIDTGNPPYKFSAIDNSGTGASLSEGEHSGVTHPPARREIGDKRMSDTSRCSSVDTAAYILSNTNVTKKAETIAIVEGAKSCNEVSAACSPKDNTALPNLDPRSHENPLVPMASRASSEPKEPSPNTPSNPSQTKTCRFIDNSIEDLTSYPQSVKLSDILPELQEFEQPLKRTTLSPPRTRSSLAKLRRKPKILQPSETGPSASRDSPNLPSRGKFQFRRRLYTGRDSPVDLVQEKSLGEAVKLSRHSWHPALDATVTVNDKRERLLRIRIRRRHKRASRASDQLSQDINSSQELDKSTEDENCRDEARYTDFFESLGLTPRNSHGKVPPRRKPSLNRTKKIPRSILPRKAKNVPPVTDCMDSSFKESENSSRIDCSELTDLTRKGENLLDGKIASVKLERLTDDIIARYTRKDLCGEPKNTQIVVRKPYKETKMDTEKIEVLTMLTHDSDSSTILICSCDEDKEQSDSDELFLSKNILGSKRKSRGSKLVGRRTSDVRKLDNEMKTIEERMEVDKTNKLTVHDNVNEQRSGNSRKQLSSCVTNSEEAISLRENNSEISSEDNGLEKCLPEVKKTSLHINEEWKRINNGRQTRLSNLSEKIEAKVSRRLRSSVGRARTFIEKEEESLEKASRLPERNSTYRRKILDAKEDGKPQSMMRRIFQSSDDGEDDFEKLVSKIVSRRESDRFERNFAEINGGSTNLTSGYGALEVSERTRKLPRCLTRLFESSDDEEVFVRELRRRTNDRRKGRRLNRGIAEETEIVEEGKREYNEDEKLKKLIETTNRRKSLRGKGMKEEGDENLAEKRTGKSGGNDRTNEVMETGIGTNIEREANNIKEKAKAEGNIKGESSKKRRSSMKKKSGASCSPQKWSSGVQISKNNCLDLDSSLKSRRAKNSSASPQKIESTALGVLERLNNENSSPMIETSRTRSKTNEANKMTLRSRIKNNDKRVLKNVLSCHVQLGSDPEIETIKGVRPSRTKRNAANSWNQGLNEEEKDKINEENIGVEKKVKIDNNELIRTSPRRTFKCLLERRSSFAKRKLRTQGRNLFEELETVSNGMDWGVEASSESLFGKITGNEAKERKASEREAKKPRILDEQTNQLDAVTENLKHEERKIDETTTKRFNQNPSRIAQHSSWMKKTSLENANTQAKTHPKNQNRGVRRRKNNYRSSAGRPNEENTSPASKRKKLNRRKLVGIRDDWETDEDNDSESGKSSANKLNARNIGYRANDMSVRLKIESSNKEEPEFATNLFLSDSTLEDVELIFTEETKSKATKNASVEDTNFSTRLQTGRNGGTPTMRFRTRLRSDSEDES